MATRYLILARTDCDNCAGDGAQVHPTWQRFQTECDAGRARYEDPYIWFEENSGYENGRLPDKEIPCKICGGYGWTDRHIELRAALRELAAEDDARTRRRHA
jgi:hypothetical protein